MSGPRLFEVRMRVQVLVIRPECRIALGIVFLLLAVAVLAVASTGGDSIDAVLRLNRDSSGDRRRLAEGHSAGKRGAIGGAVR